MTDLDEFVERLVIEKQQLIGNLAWKDAVIAYLINEGPVEIPNDDLQAFSGKPPTYTKMGVVWKITPPTESD